MRHPLLFFSIQPLDKHPVDLADSTYICNYANAKLFDFSSLFSIFSAALFSGIPSRSWYCLVNLTLKDSALLNYLAAANTSKKLDHGRKSAARLGLLRVFFSLLIFLSSHISCAFYFILDRLNLIHIFSPK